MTGAGGSAAYNFIRSVQLSGLFHTIGADANQLKLQLSPATQNLVVPSARDQDFVSALNRAFAMHGVSVLHCQPDQEVVKISEFRDDLDASVFLPSHDQILLGSDKAALNTRLAAFNVPVPESVSFGNISEMRGTIGELLERHEKVWVRARRGAGSKGALPVSRVEQGESWINWWVQEKGFEVDDFMASEFLPGREFAFQSVWQSGRLVAGQTRERLEYLYGFLSPSGQSSTPAVARTISRSDVSQTATSAILALDASPSGVYCVDMKEAQDGTPRVTEINVGRFFTTSLFFSEAGLNMPEMVIRAALGEEVKTRGLNPLADDLYWVRMVDMGHRLVRMTADGVWEPMDEQPLP